MKNQWTPRKQRATKRSLEQQSLCARDQTARKQLHQEKRRAQSTCALCVILSKKPASKVNYLLQNQSQYLGPFERRNYITYVQTIARSSRTRESALCLDMLHLLGLKYNELQRQGPAQVPQRLLYLELCHEGLSVTKQGSRSQRQPSIGGCHITPLFQLRSYLQESLRSYIQAQAILFLHSNLLNHKSYIAISYLWKTHLRMEVASIK